MAPSPVAALYLTLLLLAGHCAAQQGGGSPAQGPVRSPPCAAAAAAQARQMQKTDQQGGAQLLFLGDSITELWLGTVCGNPCIPELNCSSNPGLLRRYFGQYNPAVQAIAGDRVEQLVWRMQHGALPTQNQPRVVVLLIGTNDLSYLAKAKGGSATLEDKLAGAAPEVAHRVEGAVRLLRQRLPDAQIVLLGLLPRGMPAIPVQYAVHRWPSLSTRALALVNAQLREFAATQASVHYADCGAHFLNADRTAIDAALMPDALHPSAAGLEKLAQCIKPLVDLLMRG